MRAAWASVLSPKRPARSSDSVGACDFASISAQGWSELLAHVCPFIVSVCPVTLPSSAATALAGFAISEGASKRQLELRQDCAWSSSVDGTTIGPSGG